MKSEKSTTSMIVNALLWAAAIIGSSLILAGTEYYWDMFYLLMALSTASFLSLEENRNSIRSEWRCIQKRFGPK
jgi:hypothetical protein